MIFALTANTDLKLKARRRRKQVRTDYVLKRNALPEDVNPPKFGCQRTLYIYKTLRLKDHYTKGL